MSKTATKITKETPSIRLNIFHPISVSSFQKKKVSHPSLNLHAQHTVVEYTGGKLLIKRNATKCVSLLIIHELHATVSRWRENDLFLSFSLPLPFSFCVGIGKQTNVFIWTHKHDWLSFGSQPFMFIWIQRRRRKRNKDGKSFVRFFPLLNFKPIRTYSLICEDFLMVIKWLRKKRKFFKLKSLICCARAAGFFPFSWKIKSKIFLNGEEKMKWNQKFITMFCYRVVHTRQRVWTTLLHK